MVADDQVALAVDAFSVALDDPDNGVFLRNRSMDLARACRQSLGFVDTKPQRVRGAPKTGSISSELCVPELARTPLDHFVSQVHLRQFYSSALEGKQMYGLPAM
jgi:hypothetical protein